MFTEDNDTICAPATGVGAAAIAMIRVSGKEAFRITNRIFSKDIADAPSHSTHFGTVKNEANEIVDEVVVAVFHKGKSFTGEDTTEISCHGSSYIRQEIIRLLLKYGCRMADPGEFTMRAYFNGRMDLSQAEAIADLIASDAKKSHDVAINQMRGGYSDNIQNLRQRLMDFASLIELELDFGEEDVEFASRTELFNLVTELKQKLERLTHSFAYGNAIKNGVKTVIAGRPNAGKSTLLNALLNEERAIVSDIPGTTRDTIEEKIVIDGIVYNFIDTAGIREASDEIERIGVERTFMEAQKSNILLYVFDAKEMEIDDVLNDVQAFTQSGLNIILLANKTENLKKEVWNKKALPFPILEIAAKTNQGLDELKAILSKTVDDSAGESDTIVVNARHYEAFKKALEEMNKVEDGLNAQISGDFLAMDIRSAIRYLASITGEISTEDLLGNIFSNFCIGK